MNTIKRNVVSYLKVEDEVEFILPCYRKLKDVRIFKVCSDKLVIQLTCSPHLNPSIQVIKNSIDSAFERDTQEVTAEEFDAVFKSIMGEVDAAIHQ